MEDEKALAYINETTNISVSALSSTFRPGLAEPNLGKLISRLVFLDGLMLQESACLHIHTHMAYEYSFCLIKHSQYSIMLRLIPHVSCIAMICHVLQCGMGHSSGRRTPTSASCLSDRSCRSVASS